MLRSKIKFNVFLIMLLFLAMSGGHSSVAPCETTLVTTFHQGNRTYQVTFLETGRRDVPWPSDLVMRWRTSGDVKWHEVSRIKGVRLEKAVKLPTPSGDADVLVVSSPGGSAQFVAVVLIRKNPPGLKLLLDGELDKGSFSYRFDHKNRLLGLTFHYNKWHVDVERGKADGHVFTARDVNWNPAKYRFRHGLVYVDVTAEKDASLIDLLLAFGADDYLEVKYIQNADQRSVSYNVIQVVIFKPIGILREKTPSELRSAKRLKAMIDYSKTPYDETKIIDIKSVDDGE
ncbi:MAG: hypothetical protein ACYC0V_20705 [Armatimonadota bacterium]